MQLHIYLWTKIYVIVYIQLNLYETLLNSCYLHDCVQ